MELTADRERQAQHEAAHAAVALACGHRVRRVSIDPGVTDVDYVKVEGEDPVTAALRAMSVLFADPAEHMARALGDPDCDEERAITVAMRSVGSDHIQPLIDAARERAGVLVEDSGPFIQRIAEALVERGSLDGEAINRIRKDSDGSRTTQ